MKAIILLALLLLSGCRDPVWADLRAIASQEIGQGEVESNNKGKAVRLYLKGQEGLPWCAGFVSYCIAKSGKNIPYTLRAKDFLRLGKKVNIPKPNDLIVFTRKGGGHVGIIERVSDKEIVTIEGNLGNYPSKVKRVVYKRGNIKNFLAFVRL